ncbi:hypothetical protein B0H14DRAFT_2580892 [Mycena olivaceomarginata]|nr:hypothetical protein B0H14DRAFT_2580892 [Mycena olivaceomarginata]
MSHRMEEEMARLRKELADSKKADTKLKVALAKKSSGSRKLIPRPKGQAGKGGGYNLCSAMRLQNDKPRYNRLGVCPLAVWGRSQLVPMVCPCNKPHTPRRNNASPHPCITWSKSGDELDGSDIDGTDTTEGAGDIAICRRCVPDIRRVCKYRIGAFFDAIISLWWLRDVLTAARASPAAPA